MELFKFKFENGEYVGTENAQIEVTCSKQNIPTFCGDDELRELRFDRKFEIDNKFCKKLIANGCKIDCAESYRCKSYSITTDTKKKECKGKF